MRSVETGKYCWGTGTVSRSGYVELQLRGLAVRHVCGPPQAVEGGGMGRVAIVHGKEEKSMRWQRWYAPAASRLFGMLRFWSTRLRIDIESTVTWTVPFCFARKSSQLDYPVLLSL